MTTDNESCTTEQKQSCLNEETKSVEATLKYYLPDHNFDYKCAKHSSDMWSTLWDLNQELRVEYKHDFSRINIKMPENETGLDKEKYEEIYHEIRSEVVDKIREYLFGLMEERGYNFETFE